MWAVETQKLKAQTEMKQTKGRESPVLQKESRTVGYCQPEMEIGRIEVGRETGKGMEVWLSAAVKDHLTLSVEVNSLAGESLH